jgi:2-polyprenyl-3-methyl-5-hydroxy-6-metoxy-1,4-benzoquinol methylase
MNDRVLEGQHNSSLATALRKERQEYDAASATHMNGLRLQSRLIDRVILDKFIMSYRFNKIVVELFGERGLENKTVLSCGCGQAFFEIAMAQRGAQVFAYDISEGMLDIARHNAKIHGVSINFFRSDEGSLPDDLRMIGIKGVDLIFGASILHHLSDAHLWCEAVKPLIKKDTVGLFFEPVSSSLVDAIRSSGMNSLEQSEGEVVRTKAEYSRMLASLFPRTRAIGDLNLVSAVQKVVRGKMPSGGIGIVDQATPACYAIDKILSRMAPFRPFVWHTALVCQSG